MKVCSKCGKEVPDQNRYCISCGEKIEEVSDIATRQQAVSTSGDEENSNKGKKTGLFVGIIVVIVLAIVAIAAIAMISAKSKPVESPETEVETEDPKEVVLQAFNSIFESEKVNILEDVFGFEELFHGSLDEGSETVIAFKIDGSDDYSMSDLVGGGLEMAITSGPENLQSAVALKATYQGMDLLHADFFRENDELMLKIPELSEKLFVLTMEDDFMDQLNSSPYLGKIILDSEFGFRLRNAYADKENAGQEADEVVSNEFPALREGYKGTAAIDNLIAAMTAERSGAELRIVDGAEAECNSYEAVIPGGAFVEFFDKTSRYLLKDESLRRYIHDNLERQPNASELLDAYGSNSMDELLDTLWSEMESGLDNLLVEMRESLQDDVRMTVYVDGKGRLAALEAETELVVNGDKGKMMFDVELKGGDYLTQNVEMKLVISDESDDISFTMVKEGSYLDNNPQSSIEFTFDLIGSIISAGYSGSYQSDSGDFRIDLHGMMDTSGFDFVIEGMVNELQKGEKLDVIIDSIYLKTDQNYYAFSGKFLTKPLESEIVMPEGTKMDILEATESEWGTVIMEGYLSLMDLMSMFE